MANTQDLRRRIKSIKNTRQITRAMEMLAATERRRAQDAVLAGRAYADRAIEVLQAASQADPSVRHPLLERRPVKKRGIAVFTSDRGLAGALNANVMKAALAETSNVTFIPVGRKGAEMLKRQERPVLEAFTGIGDRPTYEQIQPIAEHIRDAFISGRVDEVTVVYPKFISTLRNEPTAVRLLPAEPPEADASGSQAQTLFEPDAETVLESLLPKLVEIQLWQAMLETKASEHSSRMVAMQNASRNASDLIDDLTLQYNQVRQAVITTEIAEIASAAAVD